MSKDWTFSIERRYSAIDWTWELTIPSDNMIGTCYSGASFTKAGGIRKMKRLKKRHLSRETTRESGTL